MENRTDSHSFAIDLHVHTSRYSECAETLIPEKLEEYAQRAGLDGVIITEHDTLWREDELQQLKEDCPGIEIYNGVEVTTRYGSHLLVLGIDDLGPIKKGSRCEDVIYHTREMGGVVILAHPYRKGLPPLSVIELMDGIEVGSTSLYEKEANLSLHLAQFLQKPILGCSDAHALSMIGWGYTQFPKRPDDIHHLCRMIKEGQGKPVLDNPFPG